MQKHHKINYIEFPAEDLESIENFYSTVFNWQFTHYGPEYLGFTDGVLEGGFTKGIVTGESGPLVILYSDNLEDSLAVLTANNATITKEIFEFPGGRRLHFLDPAGNQLAVWSHK